MAPMRLLGFDDIEPKELQQCADAEVVMDLLEKRDLRVRLRYNGLYLAPMESSKWIHVRLLDYSQKEMLSVSRAAKGNYDARWIEVDFVFPGLRDVGSAEVHLVDDDTGYSIVRSAKLGV